jgi:hypothetical protein
MVIFTTPQVLICHNGMAFKAPKIALFSTILLVGVIPKKTKIIENMQFLIFKNFNVYKHSEHLLV